MAELKRICLTPHTHGVGGMVSFQAKFAAGLAARGIDVTYDLTDEYDAVLVTGGTRQLGALRRAKKRGVPIVQRLDGINWLHRKLPTGLKHALRANLGNALLAYIRKNIATGIAYQSAFVVDWWEREYGKTMVPYTVVHNGIDLQAYSPEGANTRPDDLYRLLLVEGSLAGGYEQGLVTAVQLAEILQNEHGLQIELMVAGRVSDPLRAEWNAKARVPIHWAGLLSPEEIPQLDRSAHLLFAADLNAACPNAVIEALACGLPVAAFDTGALAELVTPEAGVVVPYGGDPWQLDPPDIPALAAAVLPVLHEQARFRAGARARAEAAFSLDTMVDQYLDMLSH